MPSAIRIVVSLSVFFCALFCAGQEVQVSPVKGGVMLGVSAQHTYQLMPGETKLPTLGVECIHKGKKSSHLVIFSPGGMVGDNNEASSKGPQSFVLTINGKKQVSDWVAYNQPDVFAYYGKTEPERMQFLQLLLGSTVSVEFKPFLTGMPTTATFDLSKLHDAMKNQLECSGE